MKALIVALLLVGSFAFADTADSIHPQHADAGSDYGGMHENPPIDEDLPVPPEEDEEELPPELSTYFDWARGRDGTGYCYEFNRNGTVANNGRPMPHRFCEEVHPSYYEFGRGQNGYWYCYQFTPYHIVMNQGRPVPEGLCRY